MSCGAPRNNVRGRHAVTLYTIGHSNRPLDDFLALVNAHALRCIADVRAFPASRRWPHFNRAALADALRAANVDYVWIPALGGRRHHARPDSPHTAWTVAAFRSYADYTETAEFQKGLDELLDHARRERTALMCAEALYWRCHRRLIADRLVVSGHRVLHIDSRSHVAEHQLPDFARVVNGRLVYDGGTQLQLV